MSPSPAQNSRIGVDIGGTFTDLVWVDEATGAVQVGKLLTTPKDPSQAVEQGVVTLLNDAGGRTADVRSLIHGTTLATNALIERKGAIVNLSSVAGPRPYAGLLAYCVSKAGVDQYTRCSALDLAPHGVRVNAVNPGVVVTELHTVTNAIPDYAGFLERSKTTHPIGRVGQAEEVASLILYLLGDQAGWLTGGTYAIDGGRALASAR
jgi:NAD(P)-dependent dehydrogenase (short-subunit alcohol dehydrogenase family)